MDRTTLAHVLVLVVVVSAAKNQIDKIDFFQKILDSTSEPVNKKTNITRVLPRRTWIGKDRSVFHSQSHSLSRLLLSLTFRLMSCAGSL